MFCFCYVNNDYWIFFTKFKWNQSENKLLVAINTLTNMTVKNKMFLNKTKVLIANTITEADVIKIFALTNQTISVVAVAGLDKSTENDHQILHSSSPLWSGLASFSWLFWSSDLQLCCFNPASLSDFFSTAGGSGFQEESCIKPAVHIKDKIKGQS